MSFISIVKSTFFIKTIFPSVIVIPLSKCNQSYFVAICCIIDLDKVLLGSIVTFFRCFLQFSTIEYLPIRKAITNFNHILNGNVLLVTIVGCCYFLCLYHTFFTSSNDNYFVIYIKL